MIRDVNGPAKALSEGEGKGFFFGSSLFLVMLSLSSRIDRIALHLLCK